MAVAITYRDLEGIAPQISWGDYTFRDGVPVSVSDSHIIQKAQGNPHFEVGEVKRGPGRPRKVAPVINEVPDDG